jgi:hypothetical protein
MSLQVGSRSTRGIAVVAGALFIVAAVTAMVAVVLYAPVLNDPGYVTSSPDATQVLAGAFLELILAIAVVGTSVTLFPLVKHQNESLALGYVCGRLLEATLIVIGAIGLLSVVILSAEFAASAEPSSAAFLAVASALVAVHDWTFLFGPGFVIGLNTLMLAYLLYSSRLVPRPIPILGLIGGTAIFVSSMAVLFGIYDQVSTLGAIAAIPVFVWEMTLAVWLIVKGFDSSLDAPEQAETLERPTQMGTPAGQTWR